MSPLQRSLRKCHIASGNQRAKQHYGGHFVLSTPSARFRRLPHRFRSSHEEEQDDDLAGANYLGGVSCSESEAEEEEECTDAESVSSDVPTNGASSRGNPREPSGVTQFFERRTTQSSLSTEIDLTVRETQKSPAWVQKLVDDGFQGFRYNDDFTRFWCGCNKTPTEGWVTGNSRGNLTKHRARSACTFDKTQLRVYDGPRARTISKRKFKSLLVESVIHCGLPFSVVESPKFKDLLTYGLGRSHLNVPSRRTVARAIGTRYTEVMKHLQTSLSEAQSPISITFDLWTDRAARGFIAITGHYFDKSLSLRAPVLAIQYLRKDSEGHTSERLYNCVSDNLHQVMGADWRSKLGCSVTDGAANVSKASQKLGSSRRCFQHSLQLMLKYFCATQEKIASAMACCNYLAKFSKISQKFRSCVGNIPAGVHTRWNSYLNSALAVYNARVKLTEYVNSADCTGDAAVNLRTRVDYLAKSGFRLLHDLVVVLQPLMNLTIDEEGDKYITSSVVLPRLIAAHRKIGQIFRNAGRNDNSCSAIIDCEVVKAWELKFYSLWNTYLEGFLHDELLLSATLLDGRNGCGRELSIALLKEAKAALTARLEKKIDLLHDEQQRAASGLGESSNAGLAVSNARSSSLGDFLLPSHYIASIFGASVPSPTTESPPLRSVDEELAALFKALVHSGMAGEWKRDPMDLFRTSSQDLSLSKSVALDVLSVPVGEAPSERVFSITSRVMKFDRHRLSPEQLSYTVFVKKNTIALGLE
eukprot:IDg1259t1